MYEEFPAFLKTDNKICSGPFLPMHGSTSGFISGVYGEDRIIHFFIMPLTSNQKIFIPGNSVMHPDFLKNGTQVNN